MFRDTPELRQPLAKEAVAVLTGVRVSIADDVGVGVGDGQMAVHPLLLLNLVVDCVIIGTEDDASVTVFSDVFVGVLEILADEKPNSSVLSTDECQHRWFV